MLRISVLAMILLPQAALAGDLSPIFGSEGTPPVQLALTTTGAPISADVITASTTRITTVATAPAPIQHVSTAAAAASR